MLAAKQPLVVPMLLRLSHFRLNSYVVLVVSKQKGITLVFKTDPLQNVDINSTFDSIAVIQKFIQREIEGQLRQMFREDLPGIIHRLSQQWIKAKVEAPYLLRHPPVSRRPVFETMSIPDLSFTHPARSSINIQSRPFSPVSGRTRSLSGVSAAGSSRRLNVVVSEHTKTNTADSTTSFPDLENYDPTYGLRPEGLPTKSAFGDFSRLFNPNRGLADLAEENSEGGEDGGEGESFDIVDWDNSILDNISTTRSLLDDVDDVIEFEKIPAVGGGTITRSRVFHSQSMVQAPSDLSSLRSASSVTQASAQSDDLVLPAIRSAPLLRHQSKYSNALSPAKASSCRHSSEISTRLSNLPDQAHRTYRTKSESALDCEPRYSSSGRPITPDSAETQHSQSSNSARSISTTPSSDAPIYLTSSSSQRRLSISSDGFYPGFLPQHDTQESDPQIVLQPSLNNTIHQLSTLSHSNHTLSPYTRSFTHFTVRSVPPRGPNTLGLSLPPDRPPVKAKRKRLYRISTKPNPDVFKDSDVDVASILSSPPAPLSEFDASDLDRYFRSQEDHTPNPLNIHPSHVRRRTNRRQS
jgi:mitochondrial distribution and morphology protein 34